METQNTPTPARTVNLYRFADLTAEAQKRAVETWRAANVWIFDNPWESEWQASRKAFTEHFRITITLRGHYNGTRDEDLANLQGDALRDYLLEHFHVEEDPSLTGFCGDCDFLLPLRLFLANPDSRNGETVLRECYEAGERAWEEDNESQGSDEIVRDRLMDNVDGALFLSDGTFLQIPDNA